ncbi:hypothetical protein [Microbulbifer sp. GL-2]|uniref:hypothetical protein n=1 Tax=Microbulbifer sp. GL-2 TaxID=2591606 RepID=UPI0011645F36|nr:hypothetical protein [Microbulbifer sp. GL-2]BBM02056.1 hypothetical protein GL2_21300 [Microbulbifer sp. GL-2]
MEPVQIFYAAIYFLLLGVPFVVAYWVRKRAVSLRSFSLVVVVSAAIMSGVVIVQWLGYDIYLGYRVASLDRDGDGFWTAEETATWSASDQKYMDAYIGDGGRNVFAAIIFPILSVIYSLLASLLYFYIAWFISRRKNA